MAFAPRSALYNDPTGVVAQYAGTDAQPAPVAAPTASHPSVLREVFGRLADYLATIGGGTALYGQAQDRKYQEDLAARLAYAKRQADVQDYATKQAIDAQYQAPPAEMQMFDWYNHASPQDRATYDQFKPVVVQGANGPVAVPRSSIGSTTPPDTFTDPETGIHYQRKPGSTNPNDPNSWEQIGGPTQPASGAFR